MSIISECPIKKYEKGLPCMLGEVVGRIVGESDKGSWGTINGIEKFSIPYFATPHGTVIETGVLYLSEITEEGMNKLIEFENECKEANREMYAGKLQEIKL